MLARVRNRGGDGECAVQGMQEWRWRRYERLCVYIMAIHVWICALSHACKLVLCFYS
jgi:hypothetical protein